MRFGIVGLGRMGSNIVKRSLDLGYEVVAFDSDANLVTNLAKDGAVVAHSLGDLATKLRPPRIVLVFVPHGEPVDDVCCEFSEVLEPGDVVADCGNSHWEDSRRHRSSLSQHGIHFLDVGTSGGLAGARNGACFMVGGDKDGFEIASPLFTGLAVDDEAVIYAGGSGAGHFTKIVHNGIEFGMVQAISEGVALLDRWDEQLDIARLLRNWNHGSVVRGWLIELAAQVFASEVDLDDLSGYVEDTGEVKWLLHWAFDRDLPAPVTATAQTSLMQYRDVSVQSKMHALIRHEFGGHPLHRVSSTD